MNKQAAEASLEEQRKLSVLISNFKKLEEGRKDYIRDLTRKLADIQRGGEFLGKCRRGGAYAFRHIC